MSIHKSQGSQFKMVILPLVPQFSRMLQRNLLYTAVTRAEQMLILLGDSQSFERSVINESVNRQTTLTKRLQQVFGGEPASTESDATATIDQPEATKAADDEKIASGEEPAAEEVQEPRRQNTGPTILTPALLSAGQIDPMIGMNGVTPADFMTQGAN
jgi:exodeoxyribonuclease V alpha subunit